MLKNILVLLLLTVFSYSGAAKSSSVFSSPLQSKIPKAKADVTVASLTASTAGSLVIPDSIKLVIGAGGIYGAFLYYGTLQEAVFSYAASDGSKFKSAWFLQLLEAFANVIIGGVGMVLSGRTVGLPQDMFALSGATQVCAKAFTSLALAAGVSFPVVTLAKSGKMVPVMIGSLLLGGATYTLREYAAVFAIIAGTCIVSMNKKKSSTKASSSLGIAFIALSLACDGITGGVQKRLKQKSAQLGVKAKPYDFMFWTNLYMGITAAVIALFGGEIQAGLSYCSLNPEIVNKILKFALCSAVGQSFIFYTISNFDPLVCTTVTTTRKVFSVLLSIFLNGHAMSSKGWAGITVASLGILSELQDKASRKKTPVQSVQTTPVPVQTKVQEGTPAQMKTQTTSTKK
jgi:UDP-galactose transporter B1